MRRIIIDTDTGSDDAWAIVEALRAVQTVKVEAVTVVCGNFLLDLCVKNALLAEEAAGTYLPPVFRGMERPLLERRLFCAENVHGADGLGGINLPPSSRTAEPKHASQAIIDLVMQNPGEIEIVTCGPLTNLAMAVLLEPALAENVKCAWILGGTADAVGNLTPAAEYNVGTDPEAAHIVLNSGMRAIWVTWDTARGSTEITQEDVEALLGSGSEAARFCALCTRALAKYYYQKYGRNTFGVIDSMVMTAALYPEVMEECFPAECRIELADAEHRGHFYVKRTETGTQSTDAYTGAETGTQSVEADIRAEAKSGDVNACGKSKAEAALVRVCTRINAARYKEIMFSLLLT